jgi:hypothetical protein
VTSWPPSSSMQHLTCPADVSPVAGAGERNGGRFMRRPGRAGRVMTCKTMPPAERSDSGMLAMNE